MIWALTGTKLENYAPDLGVDLYPGHKTEEVIGLSASRFEYAS
jgi:hypothetical protein